MERVEGIEPSSSVWKTVALPLSYTRARYTFVAVVRGNTHAGRSRPLTAAIKHKNQSDAIAVRPDGGWGWVRTNVGASQQIYSLPPLATRAPTLNGLDHAPEAFCATPPATVTRSSRNATSPRDNWQGDRRLYVKCRPSCQCPSLWSSKLNCEGCLFHRCAPRPCG